jgi:hypothetical protein
LLLCLWECFERAPKYLEDIIQEKHLSVCLWERFERDPKGLEDFLQMKHLLVCLWELFERAQRFSRFYTNKIFVCMSAGTL